MLLDVIVFSCCHFCSRSALRNNLRASVAVRSASDFLIGEFNRINFITFAGSDLLGGHPKNRRNGD